MYRLLKLAAVAGTAALTTATAEARITRIEIAKTEPAFAGASFGAAGTYERLTGKAYGEVDPRAPANAGIQDISLAPRNAGGMVEYVTDIDIVRPADRSKSNGVLFFNIVNRGNKGGLTLFNADARGTLADVNGLTTAGDGFMQRQGYTMIWFGWQPDVAAGNNRTTMTVPVARNPDGSAITGIVRSELVTTTPTTTLNLSSGWFTALATTSYPTVSTDNTTPLADGFVPTLTVRAKEQAPRVPIPNTEWSFGACPQGGPVSASDTRICYPAGFKIGRFYELTYRAKDPLVLGLGFAAARDLGAFLKAEAKDDAGHDNPVLVANAKTIVMGSSQSGRFVRSLIQLGYNRDEQGRIVFDGAFPHIGGGLMPLNVRFGQPGRAAGTEQVDRLYPGASFPFAYSSETDPLTGAKGGILDRCTATATCPKIVHAATALEMWELRQSLGFTDPLGIRDLVEPANVRSYILASTQHTAAQLPLATREPFGACQQQPNPNPHTWTVRALLANLTAWIKDGVEPPPSARPTIAAGTLVAPDQVHFPPIPANAYGNVVAAGGEIPAAAQSAACSRLRRRLSPGRIVRHPRGRAAQGRVGAIRHADGAGRRRRQRSRRHPQRLRAGADRHLYRLEPVQPKLLRGRLLHLAGKLHPVRTHPAGAVGCRRSQALHRGTLSVQGNLCGGNQEGGRRSRCRSLSAAARTRSGWCRRPSAKA